MNQETLDPTKWVEKYCDEMYRFALLRVRDNVASEELVQNTVLTALQARDNFEGRSTEKTWLFGILKNKILEYYREVKKDHKYQLELKDDADPYATDFDGKGHWQALPYSWGIDPEKASENKQIYQILSSCIDQLSPKFRNLYILREIEGMESETMCKDFEITPNNLGVMMHRIRNLLKKCIESHLLEIA